MNAQIELENLPLTEATFFILLSLAPGPRHGYAIMKDVQTLSDDRVILSTGTLYGALRRLLDQSWIERVDDLTNETDRERKAYALTNQGCCKVRPGFPRRVGQPRSDEPRSVVGPRVHSGRRAVTTSQAPNY